MEWVEERKRGLQNICNMKAEERLMGWGTVRGGKELEGWGRGRESAKTMFENPIIKFITLYTN